MRRRFMRFASAAYRRGVRPYLPVVAPTRYAGLPVAVDRKRGDRLLERFLGPFKTEDIAGYEFSLVAGLKQHVRRGDTVIVIGGGFGVTVAVAALMSAPDGIVVCYEGGAEQARHVRETAVRNGVAERVTVHHAVVGPAIAVYGSALGAALVEPEGLPECDLLELDCEGAEIEILTRMKIRPRTILVETHGAQGAPTALSRQVLEDRGYEVSDMGFAEPRFPALCESEDIRVLWGHLATSQRL